MRGKLNQPFPVNSYNGFLGSDGRWRRIISYKRDNRSLETVDFETGEVLDSVELPRPYYWGQPVFPPGGGSFCLWNRFGLLDEYLLTGERKAEHEVLHGLNLVRGSALEERCPQPDQLESPCMDDAGNVYFFFHRIERPAGFGWGKPSKLDYSAGEIQRVVRFSPKTGRCTLLEIHTSTPGDYGVIRIVGDRLVLARRKRTGSTPIKIGYTGAAPAIHESGFDLNLVSIPLSAFD